MVEKGSEASSTSWKPPSLSSAQYQGDVRVYLRARDTQVLHQLGGIADRLYLRGQFDTKPMTRQTYDSQAVNRTIQMSGEPCEERVGLGALAEESHVDPAAVILIDQHADVSTAFERFRQLHWGVETGRDKHSHRRSPRIVQPFVDRGVVRPPVEDGGLELACRGADRGEFPIA